jgi:hypothetical protein
MFGGVIIKTGTPANGEIMISNLPIEVRPEALTEHAILESSPNAGVFRRIQITPEGIMIWQGSIPANPIGMLSTISYFTR